MGELNSAIISKFKISPDVGYRTFTKIFETCVRPIFNYSSGVLGKMYRGKHVDNVQNRACRFSLGVHRYAPNHAIHGDVVCVPPKRPHFLCMFRMFRLISMDKNKLAK